jgi:hypothetical protein
MEPPKKPLHPLLVIGIVSIPIIVVEGMDHLGLIPVSVLGLLIAHVGLLAGLLISAGVGIALTIPGGIFLKRWRKRYDRYHRWKKNQCLACGYDLRAHQPGEKCPECGTMIPAKSATMESERSRS